MDIRVSALNDNIRNHGNVTNEILLGKRYPCAKSQSAVQHLPTLQQSCSLMFKVIGLSANIIIK